MENNLISVTPIKLDMTDHHLLEDLKRWHLDEMPL
jgi:broad specificity polyphosphatase/5'/3'-nucleotidase SurE